MTEKLRSGIIKKSLLPNIADVVEIDEAHVVCGHKRQPEKVEQIAHLTLQRRLKGVIGREALVANEKSPILG